MNISRRNTTTPGSENNDDSTSYTTSTASTKPTTTPTAQPGFHSSSFLKGMVVTFLAVAILHAVLDVKTMRLPAERRDLKWMELPRGDKQDKQASTTSTATNGGWNTATAASKASSPAASSMTAPSSSLPDNNNNNYNKNNNKNNNNYSNAEAKPSGPMCLGLGVGEELDRMLPRYDLVYVISHAKSGSSTMKFFAQECLDQKTHDPDFLYTSNTAVKFLHNEYKVPRFVSSRMVFEIMMMRLFQNSITNSLVIYIHREDTDRFKSGIRQVLGKKKEIKSSKKSAKATMVKRGEIIDEQEVFDEIADKRDEIGLSGARLLTCPVYESIEENRSNLVFVGIDKMDDLLQLLIKNYCPDYTDKKNRGHVNMGVNKDPKRIRLGPEAAEQAGNETVPLEEWIDAKWPLLEHAFEQRDGASCHGETRRIEQKVFSCPDQTYWYSSHEFPEDSWKPFTKAVAKSRAARAIAAAMAEAALEKDDDDDDQIGEDFLDDDNR